MPFNEDRFNRWFSAFILIGMTVAIVMTTMLKFGRADAGRAMLIISAVGSLMGVLSSVCSANGKIITFLFGLIDVSLYAVACFYGHKYGNAFLHVLYFIPMQFVGYSQWKKRGQGKSGGSVRARRLSPKQWAMYMAFFMAGAVVAYLILARFDKSAADSFIKVAVLLDVLPLMCNIIGQLLMSMAYMDQWIFWIGVNISSVIMWATTLSGAADSYALIYVIKYSFYLLNSINGLRIWLNLSRPE
ncbi:MAG: nicotinamide riboside transporter PnuC [Bacteroidales bacterium]|nr:nicotinamide mononucleotide transporter [Candidatus Cryptobacteroides onthequi]MCQ2165458.1 nicotinamide riboside transporter PnuC [Bacteroidales bacterium]